MNPPISEKGTAFNKIDYLHPSYPRCTPVFIEKISHQLLLNGQEDTVEWRKECVKIERNEEVSPVKIVFQDGSEAFGNILISRR